MIRSTCCGDTGYVDVTRRILRAFAVSCVVGLAACASTAPVVSASIESVALEAPFPIQAVPDKPPILYPVTVRAGGISVDDPWFHDAGRHEHGEKVETKQFVDSEGWTRLTIQIRPSWAPAGTTLTFAFRERADAEPEATVSGWWRVDRVSEGQPRKGELVGIEAQVHVSRTQWAKGWPMKCVFVATADAHGRPVILAGGFVVDAK
jgi:hypothetical protein